MKHHVDETRAIWQRTEFAWGTHDCILATCDHVCRVTGVDPAKPWRGTYDSEDGAQAIYEAHGGVLELFKHGMDLAGFEMGDTDFGAAVVARVGNEVVAGVYMGAMVAFTSPGRGMTEGRLPILAAWPL